MENKGFDIIGDIHGCSKTLLKLLIKLGYWQDPAGVYQHTDRTAIFLGDFIDRGPYQREVILIVSGDLRPRLCENSKY